MGAQVSIAKAKAGFAALVARAEAGEQIIVTRNGRPVACLGPLPVKKPIVYGDLAHLCPLPEDLSLPEDVIDDFAKSAISTARQLEYPRHPEPGEPS
jgi:prevent-host-death family protein